MGFGGFWFWVFRLICHFTFSSIFVGMDLQCRFYREKSPALHDLVMVKVCSVGDKGAYVELLEYNNMRGASSGFYWE